jgi:hypothetical protein
VKKFPEQGLDACGRVTRSTPVTRCDNLAQKLLSERTSLVSSRGEDKLNALSDLLRAESGSDDKLGTVELLSRVPLDKVETVVLALKERRSAQEIRKALIERIARAPLSEFQALKTVYLTHCADVEK